MASTYLQLTNRVLRRLNEVEVSSSDFADLRGVHAAAKDAVLDTVRKINNSKYKWPFNLNATDASQVLTAGTNEYAWPSQFLKADWASFQVQEDDALNAGYKYLKPINREEWVKKYKDNDDDSGSSGVSVPEFVFNSITKWGVTPAPNQAYTITFKYWINPTDLSVYSDTVTIPAEFDYVIVAGALYHMYMFNDNVERTQMIKQEYKDGLDDMVLRYFGENHHHVYVEMENT